MRDMLVAGASGYVLKDSDGDEILYAVRQAVTGGGGTLPRSHADRDRGAHRGARARAPTHPTARDRPGGAARAGGATARADLTARPRAADARHRHPRHGPDAGQGNRAPGGPLARSSRASSTARNGLARLVQRFEAAVEAGPHRVGRRGARSRARSPRRDRVVVEAPDGPAMASLNRTAAHARSSRSSSRTRWRSPPPTLRSSSP